MEAMTTEDNDARAFQQRLTGAKRRSTLLAVIGVVLVGVCFLGLLLGPLMWVCLAWTVFWALLAKRCGTLLVRRRQVEAAAFAQEMDDPNPLRPRTFYMMSMARLRGSLVLSYLGVASGVGSAIFVIGHALSWW